MTKKKSPVLTTSDILDIQIKLLQVKKSLVKPPAYHKHDSGWMKSTAKSNKKIHIKHKKVKEPLSWMKEAAKKKPKKRYF